MSAHPLPTSPPVSIAVVGAGQIGRRHAEIIASEPATRLAAIVDPAPQAHELAAKLGARWYARLGDIPTTEKPEAVVIATPNQLHVAHGLEAVALGMPVLVEKPIADDVAAGARLVAAAENAGVALLVGHHRRHNPMIGRAKAIIDAGTLGRIVSVHAFFWLEKPAPYFEPEWRRRRGAGPVFMNLIHDIDLLRHLCGDIVEVQAAHSNGVRGNEVEETAVATLRFASGALGTVNVSDAIAAPWSWEHTTGENPVYPPTDQSCYTIGGTMASLSLPRLEVWSHATPGGWQAPFKVERAIAPNEDPLRVQIRHLARVVREGEAPLVPGSEGLASLKVVVAIKRAAETGRSVAIT